MQMARAYKQLDRCPMTSILEGTYLTTGGFSYLSYFELALRR
jgi:hypothetical protein